MAATNIDKVVCVTGASGMLGSHIVKQLLEKGYTVHATVRDASSDKYAWVEDLAKGTPGTLELFSADLTKPGSFDEAVAGCTYVCHVAAAVVHVSKDPQREVIDPTVEGARTVFDSILKAKTARKVAMTSTTATISDYFLPNGHVFTEADWHTQMSIKFPYALAKTLADKLAWKACEEQKERAEKGEDGGWYFDLVTIHPSLILGEILHPSQKSSPIVVTQLMDGTLPLAPNFYWNVVHVRDVALAHIRGLEKPEASGRYIASDPGLLSMLEMGNILKQQYPKCKSPSWTMPTLLLYAVALVNPELSVGIVRRMAGRKHYYSNEKARKELGIDFIPPQQAILDTAKSLFGFGVLPASLA